MYRIKATEKKWLSDRYPRLIISDQPNKVVLKGLFDFYCEYDGKTIRDVYSVRLEIFLDGRKPLLRVTDDRLLNVLAKHSELKELADIHMYTNGALCTITPQGWDLFFGTNPNLKQFFKEYIEPYFYSQSFIEKNGVWPWKHYSHSTPGLIEWHYEHWRISGAAEATATEIFNLVYEDRDAQMLVMRACREEEFSLWNPCLCGKKTKYLDCHPFLLKLAYELKKKALNPASE